MVNMFTLLQYISSVEQCQGCINPDRSRVIKHEAFEITSLKGKAFPLSHTAELSTQHRLDVDCLCASGFW